MAKVVSHSGIVSVEMTESGFRLAKGFLHRLRLSRNDKAERDPDSGWQRDFSIGFASVEMT
ncbi:MAG: hypothetical protein WD751_02085, partial [Anaerolineales bacterium]